MFSCETWLTKDFSSVNKLYNDTLKNMLGVRRTTCNDILYVETGIPDAKTFIQIRQKNFLTKLYRRSYFRGSYLDKIINLVKNNRTPAGKYILELENTRDDIFDKF